MENIFTLEEGILLVELPEGKTAEELVKLAKSGIDQIEPNLHGLDLRINGRLTLPMAAYIGHRLAHICHSISFYVPMEKKYIKAVWH